MGGLVLGVINIAIVVAIFLLVGLLVMWFASWMGFAVPPLVQKCYLAIVFLVALYMLVSLLLGVPTFGPLGGAHYGFQR
jgi:hypothetical protein